MCGIGVSLTGVSQDFVLSCLKLLSHENSFEITEASWSNLSKDKFLEMLRCRGPDSPDGFVQLHLANQCVLEMYGCVLHLRGSKACVQPLGYPHEKPLFWVLWNGEIFGGVLYERMTKNDSDTFILSQQLYHCFQHVTSDTPESIKTFQKECLDTLEKIQGPFSVIIYFGFPVHQLWICRDKIGRRSLCFAGTSSTLVFASVCPDSTTSNTTKGCFPTGGSLIISLSPKMMYKENPCQFVPWTHPAVHAPPDFLSVSVPTPPSRSLDYVVSEFQHVLMEALRKRLDVLNNTSIGLLFSGGLDSGVLAYLTFLMAKDQCCIELVNVAFGDVPSEAPDRITALATYKELKSRLKRPNTKLICCNISSAELFTHELKILALIAPKNTHMDFNIGSALYFASRGKGVLLSEPLSDSHNTHWWDSLQHEIEKKYCGHEHDNTLKRCSVQSASSQYCVLCKSKLSKPSCINLCCRTCCKRMIQQTSDIGLDTSFNTELQKTRCKAHGHSPAHDPTSSCTPKLPIACIYDTSFSSTDYINCDLCPISHSLPVTQLTSSVLLVGHGADELFGGYSRHRAAFAHGGVQEFREELLKDIQRLWTRNLGRDDRCISASGREARHPFLDEQVLSFVSQLPVQFLISEDEDKFLLRHLARRLGLQHCSQLRKRAIQFGSRSSRQTNLLFFPSHRKANGSTIYASLS